jgi:hypothetical protein
LKAHKEDLYNIKVTNIDLYEDLGISSIGAFSKFELFFSQQNKARRLANVQVWASQREVYLEGYCKTRKKICRVVMNQEINYGGIINAM